MPFKTTRALLARDGTIYCDRGTVLPDDDPVALANINAVVGSNEPVHERFRRVPYLVTEPEEVAALTEQGDDRFLASLEEEIGSIGGSAGEEEDEGLSW